MDVHECDPSDLPHGDEFWGEVYADSGLRDDDSSYEFFSSDEWMVSNNAAPPELSEEQMEQINRDADQEEIERLLKMGVLLPYNGQLSEDGEEPLVLEAANE